MVFPLSKVPITASWSSGPQCVGDVQQLRFQARGTGFSGSISVKQGESATALMETKASGALAAYSAATEYYDLRPSTFVQVDITLSAGQMDEVLLAWGQKR